MIRESTQISKKIQKIFEEEFVKYKEYRLENWRRSYLKRIFKTLGIGSKAKTLQSDFYLDIGVGGSGYTVIEACRKGCKSIGVDLSAEGIKKANFFARACLNAQMNKLCNLLVCSADYLPFKDDAFSKVSSIAVLEHIPNDTKVVKEIARVSKISSKIFITVPNSFQRALPIFGLPYHFCIDKRVGHLRHYKAEDLIDKFVKEGFILQSLNYHAHAIKVVQHVLSLIFRSTQWFNSTWWVLEELDFKLSKIPTGLHFSICLRKNSDLGAPCGLVHTANLKDSV